MSQFPLTKIKNGEATTQDCGIKLQEYSEGYPTTVQDGVGGGRHNFFNGMEFLVSISRNMKFTMLQYIGNRTMGNVFKYLENNNSV